MNSSATLTGCDDIIKRLREAIADPALHDEGASSDDTWQAVRKFRQIASPDNITALLDRFDATERESERLRKFAGNVLEKSREEFLDLSCGDIEDWAKQCGLLEQVEMTAACGDDCQCAEWADFPLECLRPTALGSAAIDAAREKENQS